MIAVFTGVRSSRRLHNHMIWQRAMSCFHIPSPKHAYFLPSCCLVVAQRIILCLCASREAQEPTEAASNSKSAISEAKGSCTLASAGPCEPYYGACYAVSMPMRCERQWLLPVQVHRSAFGCKLPSCKLLSNHGTGA